MRIFVINLDDDRDRFLRISSRLDALNVEYERVSAVDGHRLTKERKHEVVSWFKWRCLVGQPPTDGEIGCALSHFYVYEKIVNERITCACILEDDAVISDQFLFQLERVEKFCSRNSKVIVLLSDKKGDKTTEWRIRPCYNENGAFGYVVTLEAAQKLISRCFPMRCPFDNWRWICKRCEIDLFKASPAVCDYDKTVLSKTTVGRYSVANMSLIRLISYKVMRFIGLCIAHFS